MNYLETAKTYNCSSLFLTQQLGITAQHKEEFGFLNSYLYDDSRPEDIHCIYLVFNPSNWLIFDNFLRSVKEYNYYYMDSYNLESYQILIFKLPEEFKEDFQTFLEGKYSEFTPEFKDFFSKIVRKTIKGLRKDEISLPWMIINKAKELKDYWENRLDDKIDGELWSKPNLENEKLKMYVTLTKSDSES